VYVSRSVQRGYYAAVVAATGTTYFQLISSNQPLEGETVTQRPDSSHWRFQRLTTAAFLSAVGFFVGLLLAGSSLHAQVQSGVNGTVTDSTGATIAGARVTITNTSTGVVSVASTSAEGAFTVVALIPGQYSVTVENKGFKKVETTVAVEVSKMSMLTIQMVPGSTNESVDVAASAMSLEDSNPTVGATIEPDLVQAAPIEISGLARQIDAFMYLVPGVQGNASSHNINGGVNFENEVDFNGVPVAFVDYEGNQTYINPPFEMVNEFRVVSSTFDARYGIGMGAVTYNMASGTNRLHGDAFEILRNQFFDSDGFFPSRFGPTGNPEPPVDQQNNFGFTLGGPVILPKLYNGMNRTFFHFSDDWFRQNLAQTAFGTVPTVAMKNGDFSGFVDSSGAMIPIYDPTTGQPFPGNIIPASRISPVSRSLLPFIPDPNRPGIDFGLQENENPAVPSVPITQNLWGYTLDHNLSQSQSIHFSQWRDVVTAPYFSEAAIVASGNPLQSLVNFKNVASTYLLNYAKTITPHLVVTVGASWVRNNNSISNGNQDVDFPGVVSTTTLPDIYFDGQNAPTPWGAYGGGWVTGFTRTDTDRLGIVIANNWLWTKGRHTFNIGGSYRRTLENILDCSGCGGTFNFSQKETSVPNSADPNFGLYGSSFASFLLGIPDTASRIESTTQYLRNKAFSFYIQDDIKVSKRFTLNLGLRWDVMVPFTDDTNDVYFVNELAPNPDAGGLLGVATKFGNCAGCAGITRPAIHWKDFGPRVGFAYMLTPTTVIRSGFYYTYLNGGAYEYGTNQNGLYLSALGDGEFQRLATGTNISSYGSWDQTPLVLPAPRPFSPGMADGSGFINQFCIDQNGPTDILHNCMNPTEAAWSLNIQRELPWKTFLTVGYVGNHVVHFPVTLKGRNRLPDSVLAEYGPLLGELVTSPDAVAAGIKIPYPNFVTDFGPAATVKQALERFPQFAIYQDNFENDGKSLYNAFQVQAEKRFSNGLSFLAGFTLSKNFANCQTGSSIFSGTGVDDAHDEREYAVSAIDQKYITNVIATYALPIGYGRRYLNSRGLLGQVLGGWQISAITTYAGGYPLQVYNGFGRPDIVPGVNLSTFDYGLSKAYFKGETATPPIQFTTNAFVNENQYIRGDSLRAYSALRAPPLRIENFSLMKSFPFTERLRATLRVDYFNAFNRTQLQPPDQNSLDSTFGQITNLSSQISNRQGQATFRLEF
jgi:hypothetical protein